MRSAKIILCIVSLLCVCAQAQRASSPASKRIVIAASTVLDGRGGVLHDTRIVIEGSKIVRIDPKAGPVDYDLRGLTVLPGWIDAHVHITWSLIKIFAAGGMLRGGMTLSPEQLSAACDEARKQGLRTLIETLCGPQLLPGAPKSSMVWERQTTI